LCKSDFTVTLRNNAAEIEEIHELRQKMKIIQIFFISLMSYFCAVRPLQASELQWALCGFWAEKYAKEAHLFGSVYSKALPLTAPNSTERKRDMDFLHGKWSELEDSEYLVDKEFEKKQRELGREPSHIALNSSIRTLALAIAGTVWLKEPGKTITFYQRKIENECRASGAKR